MRTDDSFCRKTDMFFVCSLELESGLSIWLPVAAIREQAMPKNRKRIVAVYSSSQFPSGISPKTSF